MTTTKRSIVTFELDEQELTALSTALDVLYEVSTQIDGDYLEKADSWNDKLNTDDVDLAREVIKTLLNGGAPTDWEIEE